jgi:hypothetical protein
VADALGGAAAAGAPQRLQYESGLESEVFPQPLKPSTQPRKDIWNIPVNKATRIAPGY